jgi:hypothetical protein
MMFSWTETGIAVYLRSVASWIVSISLCFQGNIQLKHSVVGTGLVVIFRQKY